MSGIVVAGTHSGCGKTTITLGLMAALKKKGLKVQPFKTGPDFIDAGLHRLVTGRTSRNLDLWMCGEDYVRDCHARHFAEADISVVEGVMGLYDGSLSTAALAGCLNIPVVLVVDAYGMAETAGALVKGVRDWGLGIGNRTNTQNLIPAPSFAGVIFNRVASENHFKRLKESIIDMPVLGYLPRDLNFEIPHRHLGLATADESPLSDEAIERLADTVLRYIDIEHVVKSASNNSVLSFPLVGNLSGADKEGLRTSRNDNKACIDNDSLDLPLATIRIAVARDRAFCFYYEDNLDLLRDAGADLIFFSPLEDTCLPENIDGIYIGGGYPELHAEQLSANKPMLNAVKEWAVAGGPVYAECGGMMYLSKGIWKNEDERYDMAGIFPFETVMKKRLARLGYREIKLNRRCIIGDAGAVARGHEFHYSEIADYAHVDSDGCYTVSNSDGNELQTEGYSSGNVLGSYIHLHFGSSRGLAGHMVNFMKKRGC